MELSIRVENLTKRFNGFTALDSISFSVDKGEVFGFLGPNGAGKTTTVRILTGMIAPNSGSAEVDGLPVDRNVENLHEVIGLLTESTGFYENFSAIRNLEYFAGFYSEIDVSKQVEKHLKSVGLWGHKGNKVRTFSKGMKQRLAIARALLHEPHVVFLDEPTAGLDPESAQDVRLMIKNLKEEGRTVFLCTHNLSEAESLCDRIGVIKTQLITLDTPEKLQEKVFKREVIVKMDSIDPAIIENLRKLSFIKLIRQDGNKLIIQLEDTESNRPLLVKSIVESGGMIQNVFEEKHSLEEVYLLLMHEEDKSQEKNGNQPKF